MYSLPSALLQFSRLTFSLGRVLACSPTAQGRRRPAAQQCVSGLCAVRSAQFRKGARETGWCLPGLVLTGRLGLRALVCGPPLRTRRSLADLLGLAPTDVCFPRTVSVVAWQLPVVLSATWRGGPQGYHLKPRPASEGRKRREREDHCRLVGGRLKREFIYLPWVAQDE